MSETRTISVDTLKRVRAILADEAKCLFESNTIKGQWPMEQRGVKEVHESYLDLKDLIGQVDVALAGKAKATRGR
jgi:hypothetical protein